MSEPVRFLTSFAQSVATMALYGPSHPARKRAVDASYRILRDLQAHDAQPEFSFLGDEIVYGQRPLREMRDWEWAERLASAGVQRLEFAADVSREDFEDFLDSVVARLSLSAVESVEARPGATTTSIRYGALGIRGEGRIAPLVAKDPFTVSRTYELSDEVATVEWMHEQVSARAQLPLLEAESVVRSLAVAMHGDSQMLLPLLTLKRVRRVHDDALAQRVRADDGAGGGMGMGARDVRAFGVAGMLHDLGKTRIPIEMLNKPGKLTDEERALMRATRSKARADPRRATGTRLAAARGVRASHHDQRRRVSGPARTRASATSASALVHVCDVYDALRTKRPYREAWETAADAGVHREGRGLGVRPGRRAHLRRAHAPHGGTDRARHARRSPRECAGRGPGDVSLTKGR